MKSLIIKNEEETRKFGLNLASELKPGTVIGLIGDLGTGKTTLTKFIAEGLGITEVVTSPTFTLVHEYMGGRLPLYHFDVYRINTIEDMYEIGFEEYFYGNGVCVVEWADQISELMPDYSIIIKLAYGQAEGTRIYEYTSD
jgi:tRNA threonylcarbamoyladenosine biosynthesis protein TsaE